MSDSRLSRRLHDPLTTRDMVPGMREPEADLRLSIEASTGLAKWLRGPLNPFAKGFESSQVQGQRTTDARIPSNPAALGGQGTERPRPRRWRAGHRPRSGARARAVPARAP